MEDRTIELTKTLDASLERVHAALTQPDELVRWFPSRAESDPRAGGSFEYRFEFDDATRNHVYAGEYVAVEPGRVSYPWQGAMGATEVEFTLTGSGGGAELRLVHSGWQPGADSAFDEYEQGWSFFIANLERYLGGGEDRRSADLGMHTPAAV